MSRRLEGLPRHASMHAAGVVICGKPVDEYVPLSRAADGSITTQYIMTTLEELGLLKMDFLGLRNLTVIQNAQRFIKKNRGIELDLMKIDYNDKKVLDYIGTGNTEGIFQLESAGMQSFMQELKPDTLHIQLIQIHRSNLQCLPVSKVSYTFKRHFANLVKEFGGSRIYGHNIL